MRAAVGATPAWFAWLLAVLLLISSGLTYRILASCLDVFVKTPVKLPVPLSAFPTQIGNWIGRDVPIAENILRVAANDDSLNRLYVNEPDNQMANVYIAYTARPRTMLGHRPLVCYPAGGWILEDTQKAEVISNSGRKVPCLIHRFHKPSPYYEETVVLNFYIVNGQLTSDESVFSGLGFRTPNIAGDPARYAAQVQVSSISEHSIRAATRDMVELMLDMFPDKNGKVKAAQHLKTDDALSVVD
jgi:hypothetical protein